MESSAIYSAAADAALVLHVLLAAFFVVGLVLIYLGYFLSWHWIKDPWFRITHLLGMGVVVLQSWFGLICPLTTWEMALRSRAGETAYDGSFVSYWLTDLLYYHAPPWVFIVAYTGFGVLFLFGWFLVRPRGFKRKAP